MAAQLWCVSANQEDLASSSDSRVGDLVGNSSVRLLSSQPPHLGDQDERWQDGSLEASEKESADQQGGERVPRRGTDCDNRPYTHGSVPSHLKVSERSRRRLTGNHVEDDPVFDREHDEGVGG